MKQKSGFTLIELLVAVGILGIVGGISTIIFFTTLQGTSKSEVVREVKQNGDYALTVMERLIRNATAITSTCDGTPQPTLIIINPDQSTTQFSLSATAQIASNAGFLTNNKVSASNLSFTCTRTPGQPDVVVISFTLSQAGSPTRPAEKASIDFRTTVSLRTY